MNARRKFRLDKTEGKFLGVCAGIANYLGVDATIVRIAAVVITLVGAAPWTFILYGLIAWLARPTSSLAGAADQPRSLKTSTYELNASLRDIDRRMAEVDSYVASSGGRLAREIEELR